MDDNTLPDGWRGRWSSHPCANESLEKWFQERRVVVYGIGAPPEGHWYFGPEGTSTDDDVAERGEYPSRMAACMAAEVIYG